jgi:chromosome partitioning protein
MALIVSFVSQKGGVGKSTLSRLLAREFASLGWSVKIADLDISQGTSFQWRARRLASAVEPDVPVEQFGVLSPNPGFVSTPL